MRGDAERLEDIRDAASRAMRFAESRFRRDLDDDEMLLFSLVKLIEIIGEAASHVSPSAKQRYPGIEWVDVVSMRHRLVHAYFDWNRDIIWQTVTESLPELIKQLDSSR